MTMVMDTVKSDAHILRGNRYTIIKEFHYLIGGMRVAGMMQLQELDIQ